MLCHVGEAGICTCWTLPIYYIYIYVILAYVYFDVFINVFKTPFRFSPTHQYLESTSTGYLVHAVCVMQFSIRKFGAFYFWKILLFVSAGHFVANQFVFEFWVLVPPQACWFYSSEIGGFRWCSGFLLFSKGIHLCKDRQRLNVSWNSERIYPSWRCLDYLG